MPDKSFYMAVYDGETPETWVPFPRNGTKLGEIGRIIKSRTTECEDQMIIRIELSLIAYSRALQENYAQVYGLIVDGSNIISSPGLHKVETRFEALFTRIAYKNAELKHFGLVVFVILDEQNQQSSTYDALYAFFDRVSQPAKSKEIDVNIQIIPMYEAFDCHMKTELARFRRRGDLAMIGGAV
jgi:hypothetical protein